MKYGSRDRQMKSTGKSCCCYKLQALVVDKQEKNRVSDTNKKIAHRIKRVCNRWTTAQWRRNNVLTCSTSGMERLGDK